MIEIKQKTWDDFKNIVDLKQLKIQYTEDDDYYYVFAVDNTINYTYNILKDDPITDIEVDFNDNYKQNSNYVLEKKDQYGKIVTRVSSHPDGTISCFTMSGDSTKIGEGVNIEWDFSTIDVVDNKKTKVIDVQFNDNIWIKEGKLFFHNALKNTYCSMDIICPKDNYYINDNGEPTLATEEVIINKYVINYKIQGSAPTGISLNTEEAQIDPLPQNYILRFIIIAPPEDDISNGYIGIQLYRKQLIENVNS